MRSKFHSRCHRHGELLLVLELPKPSAAIPITGGLRICSSSLFVLRFATIFVSLKKIAASGTILIVSLDAIQRCTVLFRTICYESGCPIAWIIFLIGGVGCIFWSPVVMLQSSTWIQIVSYFILDGLTCHRINIVDRGHLRGTLPKSTLLSENFSTGLASIAIGRGWVVYS